MLNNSYFSTNKILQQKVFEMQQKINKIIESYRLLNSKNIEKDKQIYFLKQQNEQLRGQIDKLKCQLSQNHEPDNSKSDNYHKNIFQSNILKEKQEGKHKDINQIRKFYNLDRYNQQGKNSAYNSNTQQDIQPKGIHPHSKINSTSKKQNHINLHHIEKTLQPSYSLKHSKSAQFQLQISKLREQVQDKNQVNKRKSIQNIDIPKQSHRVRIKNSYKDNLQNQQYDKQIKDRQLNINERKLNQQKQYFWRSNKLQQNPSMKSSPNSQKNEAVIIKKLWQERDRQIRKMDDMFADISKRLEGIP